MTNVQRVYWGPFSDDYARGKLEPGVGISVDDTNTSAAITFDKTEIEPSWIESLGRTCGLAQAVQTKVDIIMSHSIEDFFFPHNVYLWSRFTFGPAWLKVVAHNEENCDTFFTCPIACVNTVPYMGQSSNVWRMVATHRQTGQMLMQVDFFQINFDTETRRAAPMSGEYRDRMLGRITDTGGKNIKPNFPERPNIQKTVFQRIFQMTKEHLDYNGHVHYKVFIFMAFETLFEGVKQGSSALSIPVDPDCLGIQEYCVVYLKESLLGDELRCDLSTTDKDHELLVGVWNQKEEELAYFQILLGNQIKYQGKL